MRLAGFSLLALLAASCHNLTGNTSNHPPQDASAKPMVDASVHVDVPPVVPTGYLWYTGVQIAAFTRDQAQAGTTEGPAVIVEPNVTAGTHTYQDLAFDAAGNIWAIPTTGNQLVRLPAAQLKDMSRPAPDVILSSADLNGPQTLTFDGTGRLWVVNFAGAGPSVASIVRFDGLGTQGMLAATAALTIAPASDAVSTSQFQQGTGMAFDATGKLWFVSASSVLCLGNVSSMSGKVTAAPTTVISTGEAYSSIAFSPSGALWVTATHPGVGYFALRFDRPSSAPDGGADGGTRMPNARVTVPSTTTTAFVGGLGFSSDGKLWVATTDRIVAFSSPDTLSGTITAAPAVQLSVGNYVPGVASKLLFH